MNKKRDAHYYELAKQDLNSFNTTALTIISVLLVVSTFFFGREVQVFLAGCVTTQIAGTLFVTAYIKSKLTMLSREQHEMEILDADERDGNDVNFARDASEHK